MRKDVRLDDQRDDDMRSLRFDYDSVPISVAKFLRGQADRIRRQCTTSLIQIGKALLEAKRHLSHGAFLGWVECEVGIPARTAQAYMRVAGWASDKGATVAHLSPSVLYLLSTTGVPEAFVSDILSRAEAGEHIAPSVVREELKAFRSGELGKGRELEVSAQQSARGDMEWQAIAPDGGSGSAVAQLVAILAQGLSAVDFARVRDIVTSDIVLSDPKLAQNLERAFCGIQACVALI
ncbi:hypothetical protein TSA1_18035 [Bradyrhizobium nitroreducens]|uniref:DUF3102 domain-containing protein n=1 Tax=Bradyrhizobium nitroreducens TaxID=709803 RepID=A0A2M6UCX8_9BRAD|nr:DUF3102 domain-containing protein [Bradyrhizobium nitroreducens]PIT02443.1 hypothetical protein TSA1_18035 [Bradyrhizobium nitroreducens]